MERVIGRENPATLDSMNNLALVLDSRGKYEAAEEMHRATLELREMVLGRQHPDTLNSMNNLVKVLREQGKRTEAEHIHQQTLVQEDGEHPLEAEEEQGEEAVASVESGTEPMAFQSNGLREPPDDRRESGSKRRRIR